MKDEIDEKILTENSTVLKNEKQNITEDKVSEKTTSDASSKDDDEDLLYTHKPENRGGSMQWNSAFCRKPGH
jgi:hypothetical protein